MPTVLLFLCTFACLCPAVVAQVLINEVLYDPTGIDTGKEKIEIRNVGSTVIDLTGYDLYPDGIGYFTFPPASLAPGAIVVVHLRQTGANTESDFFHSTPADNLGNSSGSAALFSSTTHSAGTMVSFVQWGKGGNAWSAAAVTAGLWPSAADSVPAVSEGHSIEYDGSGSSPGDWFDQAVPTLGSTNSLPVQLVAFSGRRSGASVVLSWETVSEVDNFGFEIERREISLISTDAHGVESRNDEISDKDHWRFDLRVRGDRNSQWSKIGFVPGGGTSQVRLRYSFVDNSPHAGESFYRLRQLDRSGMFSFSDVVEISSVAQSESMILDCYPNPFNPRAALSYQLSAVGKARLSIFDVLGREVAVLVNEEKAAGIHNVTWDASGMPSGAYVAAYEVGGNRISKKILLAR